MTKKAKARGNGPKTDAKTGRFIEKNGGGPGRPALPTFLKTAAPKALQWLVDVALDDECDDDVLRMRAVERVCDFIYGAPGKARIDDAPAGTIEEQVARLERRAVQAADDGDLATVSACIKVLAGLAPERWGDKVPEAGDDAMIDVPSWVPHIEEAKQ